MARPAIVGGLGLDVRFVQRSLSLQGWRAWLSAGGFHTPQPRRRARRSALKTCDWKVFQAFIAPWDICAKVNWQAQLDRGRGQRLAYVLSD